MAELFERKMLLNLSLLKVRIIVFFLFQQCLIFLQTKYASHTTKCVLTVAYMLAGKIWGISWILQDTSIQVSLTLVWRNLNKWHCMEKSHNYHFFIVQLILNWLSSSPVLHSPPQCMCTQRSNLQRSSNRVLVNLKSDSVVLPFKFCQLIHMGDINENFKF